MKDFLSCIHDRKRQTKPKPAYDGDEVCEIQLCLKVFYVFFSFLPWCGIDIAMVVRQVKLIHCVVVGEVNVYCIVYFLSIRTHHICSVHSIL